MTDFVQRWEDEGGEGLKIPHVQNKAKQEQMRNEDYLGKRNSLRIAQNKTAFTIS